MTEPLISFDELGAELARINPVIDGMRSGFVFWMDMGNAAELPAFPPRNLRELAQSTYHPLQEVTVQKVVEVPRKNWRRKLHGAMSSMGGFGPTSTMDVGRKMICESEAAWLLDLIDAALGEVRIAGIVDLTARGWYAAIWQDWLLVGPRHAIVLSLQNDS